MFTQHMTSLNQPNKNKKEIKQETSERETQKKNPPIRSLLFW